jgi:hypothetical protein
MRIRSSREVLAMLVPQNKARKLDPKHTLTMTET